MFERTIVVGDLHGCYEEAIALLEKCKVKASDRVIFAGDLIDRGPHNDKCIDLAIRRERIQGAPSCIMGNHEETHLRHQAAFVKNGSVGQIPPSHVATRAQLRQEHYDWMALLPSFIKLPEHNAVVVHAGVFPGREIEHQSHRHLHHVQMIKPQEANQTGDMQANEKSIWPSRVPAGDDSWKFWTQFWDGPERIIFGHTVLDKPLVSEKAVGIDGGCCFGRELWAVVLPDWEIVSVKSVQPADNKRIGTYKVYGDVGAFS